jgi:dTDP-4-dehydrorhamnose reductase
MAEAERAAGATKLAGDNAICAAGGSSPILRTSWVYAAQGKNFLRTIAGLARERTELRIAADQIAAPTTAALLADAVTGIVGEGVDSLRARCAHAQGLVHLTASGEKSWHGFAGAIMEGLRARGVTLAVERIVPIRTDEYPTPAKRPRKRNWLQPSDSVASPSQMRHRVIRLTNFLDACLHTV